MGRNLNDIINSLPAERQSKIANLSDSKAEEMIANAATLTDLHKAMEKTKTEVAKSASGATKKQTSTSPKHPGVGRKT